MARTLLTWRWAVLTLVLLLAVAAMVQLGRWQWDRSVPRAERAEVDLATVVADDLPAVVGLVGTSGAAIAQDDAGALVRATGTWRAERTLLVADRAVDGTQGRWVLTALEVAGPDGPVLVPVVRGWLPAEPGSPVQDVPAPPPGQVTVVGWVQQSEPLDLPADIRQPAGVVPLLASADLANRWPEDLVPGFVVAAPTPGQREATDLLVLPRPPAESTAARDWRNLAYSAQWFVFAGFAVVLWWRMLRDDAARHDPARLDLPDDPPDDDRTDDRTDDLPVAPADHRTRAAQPGPAPRERTPS